MNKRNNQDPDIINYIIEHSEMSEQACIMTFGYSKGSASRVSKRVRAEVDRRRAEMAAEQDKRLVKEISKFDALKELADQAQAWRKSGFGVNSAHVRAAELYLHISRQTPEAQKIMADIASRAPGAPRPEGDFEPDWAKQRVN